MSQVETPPDRGKRGQSISHEQQAGRWFTCIFLNLLQM
jgi:hypothetical protein